MICQSNSISLLVNAKQKGNLTELQCIVSFIENGCDVSIPYGENSKYDFIADVNNRLLKIQVKTSSDKSGRNESITFPCRKTHVNCSGVKNERYCKDDVDFFATYWNGKCYIVPFSECSVAKTLRFSLPANGQISKICFAENYELEKQLQKLRGESI